MRATIKYLPLRLPTSTGDGGGGVEARRRETTKPRRIVNVKFLILQALVCMLLLAPELRPSTTTSQAEAGESPPRITIQPNDLIAIEGESTELNCDTEGEPEPSIEWYHNGQLIKTSTHSRTTMGGSIQFLDIRPSSSNGKPTDTGIYYCLARNPLGQAKSRNASLQVAYIKQEFRLEPKDKLVAIGDSATFDCLPQAWPEPRIQWRHNGRPIEPNESRLADGSAKYLINKIARADPSGSASDKLSQQQPSAAGEASATPIQQQGGTTTTTQPGQEQPPLVDVLGSQLVIKQVDKADEGKYSCLVETKGSHRLIERESSSGQLSALVKPYFIEAPEHQSVEVGGQVKLRCRMGGDPEPVISWRKQNGQPLSEKTQIDPVDKTLILDQLTVADQATYVCEGENSVGSTRIMATVSVNSRPKFTVQPEDQEVDQAARVQIKCAGEASPQPMLYWYKEGHRQLMFAPSSAPSAVSPLKQSLADSWPQAASLVGSASDYRSGSMSIGDTSPSINKLFTMPVNADQLSPPTFSNNYFGNRIYVDNQGTLNIVNVTSSDNGYYACALISSVGSVMAKAKLTVRHSPNSFSGASDYYDPASMQDPLNASNSNSASTVSKFDLLPPPVIKLGAANQTLPTNTSATLVCEVVSQVAYKIQWFFNSQILQEEPSRVMVLDTGALSINNLRTSDSGTYTCVVTAANEQLMPLASPFEPLDSSMLTSAPPIQQSTSHSTVLKVASPMNPNIQFYRMDTFAYPSSPGPAYLVSTNGNDAITIAWQAPADSGALPIKEYVIEHYDTSQEHLGWRVIYRIKGKESLLIDGLSADGSHFFVIRAANSRGTGPSSPIAGPLRTVAGDARYQAEIQRRRVSSDPRRVNFDLSPSGNMRGNLARERLMTIATNLLRLTPVSSTSIKLQWSTQLAGNSSPSIPSVDSSSGINFPFWTPPDVDDFLEGYSIRYRAIGIGESLLSKDPLLGANWNVWPVKNMPSSLPLITSYLDPSDEPLSRRRRDVTNYFDYSQEFNEVRVIDHNTEHYTINGLRPFTLYQFFVVPYYKDIDGVPSNIRSAQTNEDRPSVAPPNLTVRPINNTAVRLLWIHVPPIYANGILRGYVARVNRSDALNGNGLSPEQQGLVLQSSTEAPKILNLPLGSLSVAPLTPFNNEPRSQSNANGIQQYVVMFDLANLTYKSFYSVQVAATTSAGPGPWSEPQNFVMDAKVLSQLKSTGDDFDDVMSKSLISTIPQSYGNIAPGHGVPGLYLAISIALIIISIMLVIGYLLYQRNNQRVITWKKTISEHFTNKFYMPSTVDPRGPNSIQQNIYDHQQHLIYSGSMAQQPVPAQTLWTNNACMNSSGTGSLSSHGGLLPISNHPGNLTPSRVNGDQILLNNKDMRQAKNNPGQLVQQASVESARSMGHQSQIIHHGGDYYSVINNMAEYEELDAQQRNNIQLMTNADRHQTASSNSDTSCPSSVTRLLPNQNYNRDFLSKTFGENQRHEMILQQQVGCIEGKQPFATMVNNDGSRQLQSMVPLSPYATTNLMNQVSMPQQQQLFANPQMSLVDHSRQQNFVMHNGGGATMDDSSKVLMNQQQMNGLQNNMSVFRTLQRNPVNFQSRNQQFAQARPQMMLQSDINSARFHNQGHPMAQFHQAIPMVANITSNPMADMKPNLYEQIDYSDPSQNQQPSQMQQRTQHGSQAHEIISSSTSSGSMKSPPQQHSPDQQQQQPQSNLGKFRRGSSNTNFENEAHDLRVFSSANATRQIESAVNERQKLNGDPPTEGPHDDEDDIQADETTAFRQKASQSDNQRTRQLSKRKRQQQRNRLHNNNQQIG